MMMANIERLTTRNNHQTNTSTNNSPNSPSTVASSPSSYNPMPNPNNPIEVSEFNTYKLYSFDDEHLLHKTTNQQSPTNRPSYPSSPNAQSQRIETFDEAQDRQSASSVEAFLLLDKCRNELCDRKSKFGRKGPHHPLIAETYTKMGLLHQHMLQEPEKALRYHSKALDLLRKCCEAASTPNTIDITISNSDKIFEHACVQEHHQLDEQDRLELVQRCTSDIAVTLADIGHVQRSLGRNVDALMSYEEAVATFDQAGTSNHHPARNAALAGINLMTCGR